MYHRKLYPDYKIIFNHFQKIYPPHPSLSVELSLMSAL